MSDQNPAPISHPVGVLHEIRWNEICPWLILVQSWRVSLMFRVLVLAWVGLLLTQWGAWLVESNLEPLLPHAGEISNYEHMIAVFQDELVEEPYQTSLVRAWRWLSRPFLVFASPQATWSDALTYLGFGLWTIVVWGFCGTAICRIAAVYLTRGESIGVGETLQTTWKAAFSTIGAPLLPLTAGILLGLPLMFLGWLAKFDLPLFLLGCGWILVLVVGLLLAIVLMGLLLGWPLMWSAIAVERSDAFDAISRAYSYIYQRPLHLVFFILVASLLGFIGGEIVSLFVMAAEHLSEWAVSWGAGNARATDLASYSSDKSLPGNLQGLGASGAQMVYWWKGMWRTLIPAYAVAHLWSSAVGIYLLLRRYVDSTEMDEIALVYKQSPQGLPELEEGESGVPKVKRES